MKKILLITLLLIPFLGFSQTTKPIEGFLGIKFGSSKAQVIAAVKAKGGSLYKDTVDELAFSGVRLGHLNSSILFVDFIDNKVYQAVFSFQADVDDKTIDYYNDLVSQVNDIYGKGNSQKVFRSTFTDGDGYEITAIQQGDADYTTIWEDSIQNTIEAKINDHLYIDLIYQDTNLTKQAIQRFKDKEKGDF